jgi:predicted HAD superfamily Cof-like phosphohydrolase
MTKTSVDIMGDIEEFHHKFKLAYTGLPRVLPKELGPFRAGFMQEELDEYNTARVAAEAELAKPLPNMEVVAELLAGMQDALVDLVYVATGTADLQGMDFDEGWRRVHGKNMLKERAKNKSQSKRNSTFDVVKPEGWTPPSHRDLVDEHAHRQLEL